MIDESGGPANQVFLNALQCINGLRLICNHGTAYKTFQSPAKQYGGELGSNARLGEFLSLPTRDRSIANTPGSLSDFFPQTQMTNGWAINHLCMKKDRPSIRICQTP